MQQKRLFWAIDIPDDTKKVISGLQSRLRTVSADIKWVELNNLHLTVKFLGDVNISKIDDIVSAVEDLIGGSGCFELELTNIGFFPRIEQPRVIWLGVRGEADKFRHLHFKVEETLGQLGFVDRNNRFSPHLTLGRFRSLRGSVELANKVLVAASDLNSVGRVPVAAVNLMESQLTRKGPIYSIIATVQL